MQNKPDLPEVAAIVPDVTIVEELGEGGFKVAYRAIVKGKHEALKLVQIPCDPSDTSVEEINRRRVRREIEILDQCSSPFLVKLGQLAPFDCQIGDNQYVCYSEELVEGDSLRTRIKAGHQPSQVELAEIGISLLSAIADLAMKNTIHRDIKPENVIATALPDRPFILLDLGIAFVVGGTQLTLDSRDVPGTLYYIAPEMLDTNFRQSLDYRADLYTIGLTLYEYATGMNPFARRDEAQYTTLYRIKHDTPQPLSTLRPDLDITFCRLIDQFIKKLPALRPANLANLINRMESCR